MEREPSPITKELATFAAGLEAGRKEMAEELAALKADAERLAGALEQTQLGLTVLADMLKRVGLEKGEQVAVQMHRDNTAALAAYREKN